MIQYIISIEEHNEEITVVSERVEQAPTDAERRHSLAFALFLKGATECFQETLLRLAQAQGYNGKVDMFEGDAAGRMIERIRRSK